MPATSVCTAVLLGTSFGASVLPFGASLLPARSVKTSVLLVRTSLKTSVSPVTSLKTSVSPASLKTSVYKKEKKKKRRSTYMFVSQAIALIQVSIYSVNALVYFPV